MNIGMYVTRSARFWADRPAVLFGDSVLTYAALERRANRLARALLDLGLQRGDRVAIVSANRPALIEIECALYKAGLVKVALNSRLASAELADGLANAEPVLCFADAAHMEDVRRAAEVMPGLQHRVALDDVAVGAGWQPYETLLASASSDDVVRVEMAPDDLAVLHYTSGSTGKLKAAQQTVGNRMASLRKNVMGRMHVQGRDVMMLCGPITHASGMFIQALLYQGATILLLDRFDPPQVLAAMERHRVTMAFMVPTMINALLAEPSLASRDLSSLRLLSYGAAPMSETRIREAWAAFGPVLAQGYGAAETTGGVIALQAEDHRRAIEDDRADLLASCGRPSTESDVQVLNDQGEPVSGDEIGEICVRGPDVFAGYWRAPESTRAVFDDAGWLRTGDLARVDAEGFIYIVDRKKEMLVSGGFNVYPMEVETVLGRHPAVYEVCVIGVPDAHWGEAVKAVVVLRDGHEASAEELMQFCRDALAGFKVPRSVDFVAHLPKNANGKLSRKDVREPYWRGHTRRVN